MYYTELYQIVHLKLFPLILANSRFTCYICKLEKWYAGER